MKKALATTTPKSKIKEAASTAIVVASLEKKAQPAFNKLKKIEKIATQDEFEEAALQVKAIKELAKEAEAKENEMTEGLKKTLKLIKEHFKPFHDKAAKAETDIKLLMSVYLERNNKKIEKVNTDFEKGEMSVTTYAKKVAGLQLKKGAAKMRKLKRVHIFDESKIPRQYLFPNENAIEAALVNGIKVPGCRMIEVDNIAI
jgi:hypothetical protein